MIINLIIESAYALVLPVAQSSAAVRWVASGVMGGMWCGGFAAGVVPHGYRVRFPLVLICDQFGSPGTGIFLLRWVGGIGAVVVELVRW